MSGSGLEALFVRSILRDAVLMKPQFLGSNYREMLTAQLQMKLEAVCSRHGYIMPGSVAIHKVSPGRIEAVSLNGDVRFDVQYYANVCNPPVGVVLPARVVSLNKFGVMAHCGLMMPDGDFVPVLEIIVTKQPVNGIASEVDLDAVKQGDEIHVEILGKKFELNDAKISVVGRAVDPAKVMPLSSGVSNKALLPAMYDVASGVNAAEEVVPEEEDDSDAEDSELAPEEVDKEGVEDDEEDEADEEEDDDDAKDDDEEDALSDDDIGEDGFDSDADADGDEDAGGFVKVKVVKKGANKRG
jgi:DNA-directed RNA polymerase subunit E'/Rpb7